MRFHSAVALTLIALVHAPLPCAIAQESQPLDNAVVEQIQNQVAELRGLPFKHKVEAKTQTPQELDEYLDERVEGNVPEGTSKHYGKIVRKLGLYRGPEIQNAPALMKSVVASQAAAYYDPSTSTFYVLASDMPELARGVLFAHELYHGLQDQYFDLDAYMRPGGRGETNNDQVLARQSVVEGEATYMMSMWMVQYAMGRTPTRATMEPLVRMQSALDLQAVAASLEQPQVAAAVGADIQAAIEASQDIPPFIMDMMMGVYLKGLGFVFDVHQQGWTEVEKLYREYPPVSTEQILHPEKWFARETPLAIEFPSLKRARALKDWEVLEENSIGEFLWRTIFREHGLGQEAQSLAAGWDGDRYAVLQRKGSDDLLLLLNTAWDTEADAIEFANAYQRLLEVKYEQRNEPTRIERSGKQVFVVEGGTERSLTELMKLTKKAKKRRIQ